MIRCDDVHVRYPGSAKGVPSALRGVSLSIAPGEMVGLLGPNGSGKTTLLRAMAGLLPLAQGRVSLAGRDISAYAHNERAKLMAAVPQRPETVPDLPVAALVLMGRYCHRPFFRSYSADDKEHMRQALGETGIAHLAERSARTLSGGELQRLLVARAFAQASPTLLLDEAATGLDVAHTVAVFDRVRQRNKVQGTRVIAAIHDLNLAALYCDRLIILKNGQVHADGPTAGVFTTASLEAVYENRLAVAPHPVTGAPQAFFLPGTSVSNPEGGV